MKRIVLAAGLSLLFVTGGCGEEQVNREEYGQRLASALATVDDGEPDSLREAADSLDDLDPPEGLDDPNDELADALRDLADDGDDDDDNGGDDPFGADDGGDDEDGDEDQGNDDDDPFADEDDGDEDDGDEDASERVERALAELERQGYDVPGRGEEDED